MTPYHPAPGQHGDYVQYLNTIGAVDIYVFSNGPTDFLINFGYGCIVHRYSLYKDIERNAIRLNEPPHAPGSATLFHHPLREEIDQFIEAYKNLLA